MRGEEIENQAWMCNHKSNKFISVTNNFRMTSILLVFVRRTHTHPLSPLCDRCQNVPKRRCGDSVLFDEDPRKEKQQEENLNEEKFLFIKRKRKIIIIIARHEEEQEEPWKWQWLNFHHLKGMCSIFIKTKF